MDNEEITVCDRCSCELPLDEAYTGEPGTEYEGCSLCAICNGENNEGADHG